MYLNLTYKYSLLRNTIFIYFFLIIFDGIFRKWILPSMSTPIMAIKQVFAIIIVILGIIYIKRFSFWEYSFAIIGVIVYFTSIIAGHGNHIVALYGCLPYWFGLPVCYIIGKTLLSKDIILINKIIIITSIFNSILVIIQYILPSGHILNYQGWYAGDVINDINIPVSELAGGYRPAGIFYHNSQNTLFSLLSISIILYYILFKKIDYQRTYIYIAFFLDIIACFCSTSRTNMILHILLILYITVIINKQYIKQILLISIIILPIGILISNTKQGEKAINNIGKRFESASVQQFGTENIIIGTALDIYYRNIQYNIDAIVNPKTIDGTDVPLWGYGQGMSTQIGGRILGVKKNAGFALAEWDGLRIMCESGILLGWLIIIIRMGYSLKYLPILYKLKKYNILLPLVIYPSFFISFYLITTWGNLFLANYAFFVAGLFMALIENLKREVYILKNKEK